MKRTNNDKPRTLHINAIILDTIAIGGSSDDDRLPKIDTILISNALRLVGGVLGFSPELLGSLDERADPDFFQFCMRKVKTKGLGGAWKKQVQALESAGNFGVW